MGVHWAADCAFFSRGFIVTSTTMNTNRQVSLLKYETLGIICNLDISTMHPPPPNHSVPKIYSMTAYCHSMHIKRDRVSLIVMQWFIINLGSIDYN